MDFMERHLTLVIGPEDALSVTKQPQHCALGGLVPSPQWKGSLEDL